MKFIPIPWSNRRPAGPMLTPEDFGKYSDTITALARQYGQPQNTPQTPRAPQLQANRQHA